MRNFFFNKPVFVVSTDSASLDLTSSELTASVLRRPLLADSDFLVTTDVTVVDSAFVSVSSISLTAT